MRGTFIIHLDYFISAGYKYADIEHFVAVPFLRHKFTTAKNS